MTHGHGHWCGIARVGGGWMWANEEKMGTTVIASIIKDNEK